MAYLQSLSTNPSYLAPSKPQKKLTTLKPHATKISACLLSDHELPKISTPISQASKEIMEMDKNFIVGTYARAPIVLEKGIGCKVYDVDGKEYLDMAAGIAVNSLGHGDTDWLKALIEQAGTLTHVSNIFHTIPQVNLAKKLVESSFADKVFFANSGTEANEAAIKFSRKYQRFTHQNPQNAPVNFLSFSNSFHGRTLGSLALTSKEKYRAPFEPVMPGVAFLEYGDLEAAVKEIEKGGVAAVFVEPVQGEGGIYGASMEFLWGLRKACDEHGVLLVFDEVQCGLGRTGHLWAHEAYNIYPDIMTLAKPLAGGLPIGAVLTTQKVAESIAAADHGSTFAGGPLICHAALSVLDKINDPDFLENVKSKGVYLQSLLREKLRGCERVREIRGMGLIVGIELDCGAEQLVGNCRERGVLVLTAGKGNVVRLVPPLVITEEELEFGVEVICECLFELDQK
ncbi:hypothetical protein LUZ60_003763 [Juncus effusus]|nr:hypothetical protein LUZ60_003763 [Juncus effusus]